MVLLHGLGATAALNWCHCFEPLAERYRVVALDQRGHGRGIVSRSPFRLEDCAADVAALVAVLGTDPVVAVGYSMGGPVALTLLRNHPSAVSGLVLCATAASFHDGPIPRAALQAAAVGASLTWAALPPALRERALAVGRRAAAGATPLPGPRLPARAAQESGTAAPATLIQAAGALAGFDASPWLRTVDRPTGVVVTTRDRVVSPARQWALARGIPSAEAVPVDSDHRACVEDPALFVPALLRACSAATGR